MTGRVLQADAWTGLGMRGVPHDRWKEGRKQTEQEERPHGKPAKASAICYQLWTGNRPQSHPVSCKQHWMWPCAPAMLSHWLPDTRGPEQGAVWSRSRPWKSCQLRLSADHTPWNLAANLPLKGDLGAHLHVYSSSLGPTRLLFLYAQGAAPAEFWTCVLRGILEEGLTTSPIYCCSWSYGHNSLLSPSITIDSRLFHLQEPPLLTLMACWVVQPRPWEVFMATYSRLAEI